MKIYSNKGLKKFLMVLSVFAVSTGMLALDESSIKASAEESVYTATATGYYRYPGTGTIIDSGGDENEALGQSMVDSMVYPQGLIFTDASGSTGAVFRFNLMDNISQVSFETQNAGDAEWTSVSYEITGSTDTTTDFAIPLTSEDNYIKATCYVDAMGRSVIFFVHLSDKTSGNSTDLAVPTGGLSGSSSTSVSSSSSTSTSDSSLATESAETPDNLGLTIGLASDSDENADDEEAGEVSEFDSSLIGESVWLTLFATVFAAVFLAGLLLMLIAFLIFRIKKNKEEIRQLKLNKIDSAPQDLYEDDDNFLVDDLENDYEKK